MPKERVVHHCSSCGASASRWTGRCGHCGTWNSIEERTIDRGPTRKIAAVPISLGAIDPSGGLPVPTGLCELDRCLGGGLVPGSVTLLGGEPGVGKSTLILELAASVTANGASALLVSAEESAEQVRTRAVRLGPLADRVSVLETTELESAIEAASATRPALVIIDSIQTINDSGIRAASGSVVQVRECAGRLVQFAKQERIAVVLVSHVTKEGILAGPRVLEHLVDTVCMLEGDRNHALRTLSVTKHRFGPAGELGLFQMTTNGLEAVTDPSALLLADRRPGIAGSAVVPVIEGRRPFLAEIQALVVRSVLANPRRTAQGLAPSRLALLLAVLEQRAGFSLYGLDVFSSVVGGIRVLEPAADLALCLALASAIVGVPLGEDLVVMGEVGLGGEIRQVISAERRLEEAARRGFRRAIVPVLVPDPPPGIELIKVATLTEAVAVCEFSGRTLEVAGSFGAE